MHPFLCPLKLRTSGSIRFESDDYIWIITYIIAQKLKFSFKDFFSKCDQIRSFIWIWSHLLNKILSGKLQFLCSIHYAQNKFSFGIWQERTMNPVKTSQMNQKNFEKWIHSDQQSRIVLLFLSFFSFVHFFFFYLFLFLYLYIF